MLQGDGTGDLAGLYAAAYPRLVAQAIAVCGDRAEAEDAVQEAFTRALLRPDGIHRMDHPGAWLRTVTLNVLRSRLRRTRRWLGLLSQLAPASTDPVSPDRVALLGALSSLPYAQREAIALHHVGDLPVREVALTLGVPEGTVKARLSRGRAALAQLLGDEHSEVSDRAGR